MTTRDCSTSSPSARAVLALPSLSPELPFVREAAELVLGCHAPRRPAAPPARRDAIARLSDANPPDRLAKLATTCARAYCASLVAPMPRLCGPGPVRSGADLVRDWKVTLPAGRTRRTPASSSSSRSRPRPVAHRSGSARRPGT